MENHWFPSLQEVAFCRQEVEYLVNRKIGCIFNLHTSLSSRKGLCVSVNVCPMGIATFQMALQL